MDELKVYLDVRGNAAALSEKTGIPAPSISRIKAGKMGVTLQKAVLIEIATDCQVKAESMIKDSEDQLVLAYLRKAA